MSWTILDQRLAELEQRKAALDSRRPLPDHAVARLHKQLELDWTYHSNAIEGSTLSRDETEVAMSGRLVPGKSPREHLEAIDHGKAVRFVRSLVADREPVSEWNIRSIHGAVMRRVMPGAAGTYRRENVAIKGARTVPTAYLHLDEAMGDVVRWHAHAGAMNPVARAAELSTRFVCVHPFVDGNGRTARLLMNMELLRTGYPPAIIRVDDRLAYYAALDEAWLTGDYGGITMLVAEAVGRTFDLYDHELG